MLLCRIACISHQFQSISDYENVKSLLRTHRAIYKLYFPCLQHANRCFVGVEVSTYAFDIPSGKLRNWMLIIFHNRLQVPKSSTHTYRSSTF